MLKKFISFVIVFCFALSFNARPVHAAASSFLDIYLEDNGAQVVRYKSKAATVADFVKEIDLCLNEKDELNVPLTDRLRHEMKITVKRGFLVRVIVDGVNTAMWAKDNYAIGNLIADLKEKSGVRYFYGAPLNTPVVIGSEYVLTSERFERVTESYLIPYEVFIFETYDLVEGDEVVGSYGDPGVREVTYDIRYVGGVEAGREVVSVATIKEPAPHIVYCGIKPLRQEIAANPASEAVIENVTVPTPISEPVSDPTPAVTPDPAPEQTAEAAAEPDGEQEPEPVRTVVIDGETYDYIADFDMSASAYTAASSGKSESSSAFGITATGIRAERGVVAVDPSVIPLGSKLYIEGYGFAKAADTGPSIKGNKIDLYYETLAEARQFGRRNIKVYLISVP